MPPPIADTCLTTPCQFAMSTTDHDNAHARSGTLYQWEGKDSDGKAVRGVMQAAGPAVVSATLRRRHIKTTRVMKKSRPREPAFGAKDLALFTRLLAAMLKAGVPLLQAFGIVARSQANAALARLILALRADVEGGSSLHRAFARHPRHFNALFCNLVAAGEQAGLLDEVLASLALCQEKSLATRSKVRTAMTYPAAIVGFAVLVTAVIMIWVVPSFTDVFQSVGAELPVPTQVVIALSGFLTTYGWALAGAIVVAAMLWCHAWRRSASLRARTDRWLLGLPLIGNVVCKAVLARWSRTLATLFAAGVPLVDALESVRGAAGNAVYADATAVIGRKVADGVSLAMAIETTGLFPEMVSQLVLIGEESGALDQMLAKAAEFYETDVDEAVASLSTLAEPFIMLVLGVIIGGLVISMYLPIFKLGSVI